MKDSFKPLSPYDQFLKDNPNLIGFGNVFYSKKDGSYKGHLAYDKDVPYCYLTSGVVPMFWDGEEWSNIHPSAIKPNWWKGLK